MDEEWIEKQESLVAMGCFSITNAFLSANAAIVQLLWRSLRFFPLMLMLVSQEAAKLFIIQHRFKSEIFLMNLENLNRVAGSVSDYSTNSLAPSCWGGRFYSYAIAQSRTHAECQSLPHN